MKSLFTQEKMGSLRVERKDLEEYLQQLHTDNQRHVDLVLPADIPPVGEIGSQVGDGERGARGWAMERGVQEVG